MSKDLGMVRLYQQFYDEYSKKYGSNTVIFLMVGKFYELYCWISPLTGEPSNSMKRAIELMNIAIKDKQNYGPKGEPGLWGGIPEQSCHKFAQVLTREGWTVVVVDQVKNPSTDSVIDRRAARVLSPGTHVETAVADRMCVAALLTTATTYAASLMDLTTGEVFSYETKSADDILHMFQVYCVKETIVTQQETSFDSSTLRSMFSIHGLLHQTDFTGHNFNSEFTREEYLRKVFRIKSALPVRAYLGLLESSENLEKGLILLLRFVEDHFPQQSERITKHEVYTPEHHMRLSNNILEQLNMITFNTNRSILNILERTHSAIGKRALRERILRPITDSIELERRWSQVAWSVMLSQDLRRGYERDMKSLYDLPRLHYRLAEGRLEATDVLQMFQSYSATTCLIQNLRGTPLECPEELEQAIDDYRQQIKTLLDEEKAARRQAEEPIGFLTPISGPQTVSLEGKIQTIQETWQRTWSVFCKDIGIPIDSFSLQQKGDGEFVWEGPRSYLKALEGHQFAMTKQASQTLKGLAIDKKKSGPITLTCAELYTYLDSLRSASADLNAALRREVVPVCDQLWDCVKGFQTEWVGWLGSVDSTLALGAVAKELHWCRPSLGNSLEIHGLRHPLLDSAQTRMEYVKHSVKLGNSEKGWLIYGVNASGKSSLMKATGIAVLLAQAGCFVPADSMCLRPYDAAFSRIWSHDNVWAGLSSFAVEISELRDILARATDKSLVLGDEVCSGTESLSATGLVASTLEHLDSVRAHFMFATHLHDLQKVPGFLPRPGIAVWHLRVIRTPEGKLIYDRSLQPGSGKSTYGLEVAKAMGIPFSVLERAHEIRRSLGGEVSEEEAPKSSWNAAIQRKSCEVCGIAVVKDLEVHHITPRAEGGGNQLRNLVVLCEACHDKHHAGELEVGELRMTSEGLERSSALSSVPSGKQSKTQWTEEQRDAIRTIVQKHKGRPTKRIILAIKEDCNMSLSAAQLKPFLG
jgi:DNA mismatch repair protein MutS